MCSCNTYLTASCLPEPFPRGNDVSIVGMARCVREQASTLRVDEEILLDGRAETSIAEPTVVVGEKVDDRSTLATGCSGCLDGGDVGLEVVHIHDPLVSIICLLLPEMCTLPALDSQVTIRGELQVDDVLELHLLLARTPERTNVHTDVAEVDGEILHDQIRPREDFLQDVGVLVVKVEALLAVVDCAGLGVHLVACRENRRVQVYLRRKRAPFAVEAVDNQDSVGLEVVERAAESSLLSLTEELPVHHESQLLGETEKVECAHSRVGCLAGLHRGRLKRIGW